MAVEVKEAGFEKVNDVHRKIPEFEEDHLEDRYHERLPDSDYLSLVAEVDGEEAAYGVAYDKFDDGSFYLWMAATIPEKRRHGCMSAIVGRCEDYARENGYESLKIKTRNENVEMRKFLAEKGFKVCGYNEFDSLDRSEILTVKPF